MRIPGTTFSDNGPSGPPAEIEFKDFEKVDLRLGTVKAAERVPDTDKLIRMQVSFGSFERQIVAGIGKVFDPSVIIGRQYAFVVNLAPRKFKAGGGIESHGMMLAASANDTLLLIGTTDLGPLLPDGTTIG